MESINSYQRKLFQRKKLTPYLLISPVLLFIILFLFYPMINVLIHSFHKFNILKIRGNKPVGIANYITILAKDAIFWKSLAISIKWVLYTVGIQLVFGMFVAISVNRSFRCRACIRTLLFTPWAISGVLVSMLWLLLTNEHMGLINSLLIDTGAIRTGIAWTGNPKTVFGVIVSAEVWRGLPFFVIILLAALQAIPLEIFDSAKVDGANDLQLFFRITLPHLKSSIVFSVLLRIIWEFNNVDVIYVITKGGPANKTLTLAMYTINKAVKQGEFGYGSALNIISFVVMLLFIFIYLKLTRYGENV